MTLFNCDFLIIIIHAHAECDEADLSSHSECKVIWLPRHFVWCGLLARSKLARYKWPRLYAVLSRIQWLS